MDLNGWCGWGMGGVALSGWCGWGMGGVDDD